MDNVRFTGPVFIGDTIRTESEVLKARPSKSRPDSGVLKFKNTVKNQRDETVAYLGNHFNGRQKYGNDYTRRASFIAFGLINMVFVEQMK